MYILGINNMHDASAALICDGKIIAAAEEERFTREKHMIGFPVHAIQYCLNEAGITINDIDLVAVAWKPWVLKRRILEAAKVLIYSRQAFKSKTSRGMGQMKNEWFQLFSMRSLIEKHFGKGKFKLKYIDHHLSHAASAFYVSPYDSAAVFTVDGAGEEATTVFWKGEGTKLTKIKAINLPHSIGQFYSAITAFLGFKVQADEYKVMGLASYGRPKYADYFKKDVLVTLPEGGFRLNHMFIDYHLARYGIFLPSTIDILGQPRKIENDVTSNHGDIAASAQKVVEDTIFHSLRYLYGKTGKENRLCMAGGVALNCVANGKITEHTEFKDIYIQPAAGDAGTSLGAALYLYHSYSGKPREFVMRDAYLGPQYSNTQCETALRSFNLSYKELPAEELCRIVAGKIADGKLVCWFQGRMEWGPRALGNRSLIADPRKKEMKDIINLKVKQRESFRPFAPSVLAERSSEYFCNGSPSPFMLFACGVRPEKAHEIPAVIHVDGTARPQTVSRETNPMYWSLIKEFENITGVPVILNTSFNVQEPIVCTPEDAIKCFLKTKVDYLVLNNLLISQN